MSQNPYQQPGQPGPIQPKPGGQNSPLAMVSMGLGIGGILTGLISIVCCLGFVSVPLGIGAIITGFIGLNQIKNGPYEGAQFAKIGIGCGIGAIAIFAIMFAIGFAIGLAGALNN